MKLPSTMPIFKETLPTNDPKIAPSQRGEIAQRFFKNLIQFFTQLIMGLASQVSPKRLSFFLLLVAIITVVPCAPVFSANVSVAWNKNTESDLAGYKIYKRTLPSQDFGQPVFSGLPNNPSLNNRIRSQWRHNLWIYLYSI